LKIGALLLTIVVFGAATMQPSLGMPGRDTVDGARLIRPAVAPQGLGGPAKVVAGINGTTLRSKR
jgi:hypothetical protein